MQFLQEQKTALCILVLGFGFLRRSTSRMCSRHSLPPPSMESSCIHTVVCAVLFCSHKKIIIFNIYRFNFYYFFSACITGAVSGFTPCHIKKASAACSTNIPKPSTTFDAPCSAAHFMNIVSVSEYIKS